MESILKEKSSNSGGCSNLHFFACSVSSPFTNILSLSEELHVEFMHFAFTIDIHNFFDNFFTCTFLEMKMKFLILHVIFTFDVHSFLDNHITEKSKVVVSPRSKMSSPTNTSMRSCSCRCSW